LLTFRTIIEAQSRYINGLIKPVLDAKKTGGSLSLQPSPEKMEDYNEQLQRRLRTFAVSDSRCTNWYKNDMGKVTNLWPGTMLEYQLVMENVNYNDYIAEGSRTDIVRERPKHYVGRVHEQGVVFDKITCTASVAMVLGAGYCMWTLLPVQRS
jgi:hypothetical protein